MNVVLVTGGFDPLHSGHIEYFIEAKKLGDKLVVGVNTDAWLKRKKGRPFMPGGERISIIKNLSMVDHCLLFGDDDDSAIEAINNVRLLYPDAHIIFANGGDRTSENIPEMEADVENISFKFGVGGEIKANSSSWILDEWKTQKTERDWGYWRVLDDKPDKGYKVKELVIYPGKSLSDQKHFKRSEEWNVLEGTVKMDTEWNSIQSSIILEPKSRTFEIGEQVWHKASNPGTENTHILEVQWGDCYEEDIERRD
ncbi:adenylyltransferase/cytidyltransferase family protein [bacterium]|jgi:cytidyltransferase-like protein|nr:adenylyltransferase/cytidyltransferase family protein [bacterium]